MSLLYVIKTDNVIYDVEGDKICTGDMYILVYGDVIVFSTMLIEELVYGATTTTTNISVSTSCDKFAHDVIERFKQETNNVIDVGDDMTAAVGAFCEAITNSVDSGSVDRYMINLDQC